MFGGGEFENGIPSSTTTYILFLKNWKVQTIQFPDQWQMTQLPWSIIKAKVIFDCQKNTTGWFTYSQFKLLDFDHPITYLFLVIWVLLLIFSKKHSKVYLLCFKWSVWSLADIICLLAYFKAKGVVYLILLKSSDLHWLGKSEEDLN